MPTDIVLGYINSSKRMLTKAKTEQEAKAVVAMAEAVQVYTKRVGATRETMNEAAEFRLDAEKHLGEIMEKTPKAKGTRGQLRGRKPSGASKTEAPEDDVPTLAESGIDWKLSSRAQLLASVPKELYKAEIEKGKAGDLNPNKVVKTLREAAQKNKRDAKRKSAAKTVGKIDQRIIVGDFREHAEVVADGSVSLIFTDPPYNRKASAMLPDLASFAAAKLADGGSLLCYVGQTQLPAAMDAFRTCLRYWWIVACVHSGRRTVMREYGINCGWKAVLWFVNGTRHDNSIMVSDTMSGGEEKDHHEWQQAESEAAYWIEKLCPKDGLIVDPYLGSGTTAAAAKALGRRWIGFELDKNTAAVATERLE